MCPPKLDVSKEAQEQGRLFCKGWLCVLAFVRLAIRVTYNIKIDETSIFNVLLNIWLLMPVLSLFKLSVLSIQIYHFGQNNGNLLL